MNNTLVPKPQQPSPLNTLISETINLTTLSSGLKIVTEHLNWVETVAVGVYIRVGARNETIQENGITHFLEHMAFKGTKQRSARKIVEDIENIGGYINAYTDKEQTSYYVNVMKDDIALAIEILGDIITNSVFLTEEMERERNVILQEIAQVSDTPDDVIFDDLFATAFPNQPIGRPVLGSLKNISKLQRDQLIAYMQRNYTPDRIIISACGNLDHNTILELVEHHFEKLRPYPNVPWKRAQYKGGNNYQVKKELDQTHIVLAFKGASYGLPNYYDELLLSTVLGGGMSSRLFQELREKRGLIYALQAEISPFYDIGLFSLYAATGHRQVAELLLALVEQIHAICREVSQHEIKRACAQIKSSMLMGLESTINRAERHARHLQIYNRLLSPHEILAKLDKVTTDRLTQAAKDLFSGPLTFVCRGPSCDTDKFLTILSQLRYV